MTAISCVRATVSSLLFLATATLIGISTLKYLARRRATFFQDERCLDCGIVGDRRLVPGICHLRRIEVLECLRSTFILCHFKKKYKENINVKTQKESDSYVDIRQFQYRSYYIYFSPINVFNHHSQIYDRSTVSPTRRALTTTTAGTTHRPQFSAILVT